MRDPLERREVTIPAGSVVLSGAVGVPDRAGGVVLFAHGSGSSRFSPRNRSVAEALERRGFATLLFDLLTPSEGADRSKVFDIPLLAERLLHATRWIERELPGVPVGYFGASTGAAAALVAAASGEVEVRAVVSRGGRPDLAGASLPKVVAPTLLVVGGADHPVLEWNVDARRRLGGPSEVAVVPGATHLFEERGALERVVDLAVEWFERYLAHPAPRQPAQPVR